MFRRVLVTLEKPRKTKPYRSDITEFRNSEVLSRHSQLTSFVSKKLITCYMIYSRILSTLNFLLVFAFQTLTVEHRFERCINFVFELSRKTCAVFNSCTCHIVSEFTSSRLLRPDNQRTHSRIIQVNLSPLI